MPAFAAAACAAPGQPDRAWVEGDGDDAAAAVGFAEMRKSGLAAMERAVEVDVDHRLPAVRRKLRSRADEIASRIVDQDVERTEALGAGLDRRLDLGVVANVGHGVVRRDPFGGKLFHGGAQSFFVTARQEDAGAQVTKSFGDAAADARRAARDEGRSPVEETGCKMVKLRQS